MDILLKGRQPIEVPRPRGTHRIEAFSPKLGRRLKFYSRSVFSLWILVESNPKVLTFCERPAYIEHEGQIRLVDFWVDYGSSNEYLVLSSALNENPTAHSRAQKVTVSPIPIHTVDTVDLMTADTWISNWERILPFVSANQKLIPLALLESLTRSFVEPMPLSSVEHQFALNDLPLIRATVFTLLHSGHLEAPTLHTQELSLSTMFGRAGSSQ
jgi:hypothetical protein